MFRSGDQGLFALLLNIYINCAISVAGCNPQIQQMFCQELRQKVKLDPKDYVSEKGTKMLGRSGKTSFCRKGPKNHYDIQCAVIYPTDH